MDGVSENDGVILSTAAVPASRRLRTRGAASHWHPDIETEEVETFTAPAPRTYSVIHDISASHICLSHYPQSASMLIKSLWKSINRREVVHKFVLLAQRFSIDIDGTQECVSLPMLTDFQ